MTAGSSVPQLDREAMYRIYAEQQRRLKKIAHRKIMHPATYDLPPAKSRYEQIQYRLFDFAGLSVRAADDIARLTAQLDSISHRLEKAERRRDRYQAKMAGCSAQLAVLDAQIASIKKPIPDRQESNDGHIYGARALLRPRLVAEVTA